uniref:Uncharacterized protein n=1 Tax=Arundo donax TaxID=35708 RepID=A0A0A8ZIM5_ARUDO
MSWSVQIEQQLSFDWNSYIKHKGNCWQCLVKFQYA